MPLANVHCVNVIAPRRPGCRTHTVELVLVSADSPAQAVRKVALSLPEYAGDSRVLYRNSFGDADNHDTLTWSWQTWTRDDAEGVGTLVSELRQDPDEQRRLAALAALAEQRDAAVAALREILDHFQRTGDPTLGDMAPRARAAIARATQEA